MAAEVPTCCCCWFVYLCRILVIIVDRVPTCELNMAAVCSAIHFDRSEALSLLHAFFRHVGQVSAHTGAELDFGFATLFVGPSQLTSVFKPSFLATVKQSQVLAGRTASSKCSSIAIQTEADSKNVSRSSTPVSKVSSIKAPSPKPALIDVSTTTKSDAVMPADAKAVLESKPSTPVPNRPSSSLSHRSQHSQHKQKVTTPRPQSATPQRQATSARSKRSPVCDMCKSREQQLIDHRKRIEEEKQRDKELALIFAKEAQITTLEEEERIRTARLRRLAADQYNRSMSAVCCVMKELLSETAFKKAC